MLIGLTAEPAKNGANFFPARFLLQVDQKVRGAKIPVVFRDFVFQDKVVPVCVPCKVRYQAMVLVKVVSIMGEY